MMIECQMEHVAQTLRGFILDFLGLRHELQAVCFAYFTNTDGQIVFVWRWGWKMRQCNICWRKCESKCFRFLRTIYFLRCFLSLLKISICNPLFHRPCVSTPLFFWQLVIERRNRSYDSLTFRCPICFDALYISISSHTLWPGTYILPRQPQVWCFKTAYGPLKILKKRRS